MNKKTISHTIAAISFAGCALSASAEEFDCFPACADANKTEIPETSTAKKMEADCAQATSASPSQTEAVIKQVESVNNQLKPIKEIIGYIRSPQGLAIKLVNDNIVKIPVWVGYAIDPIGSIKHRAMDEVRDYAKTTIKEAVSHKKACDAPAIIPSADVSMESSPVLPPVDRDNTI